MLAAIAIRDTQLNTAQVLGQLGGGKMATALPASDEIPATVTAKSGKAALMFSSSIVLMLP